MRGNHPKNYVIRYNTVNIKKKKKKITINTVKDMDGLTNLIAKYDLFNLEVNSSIWTFEDIELSMISRRNLVV